MTFSGHMWCHCKAFLVQVVTIGHSVSLILVASLGQMYQTCLKIFVENLSTFTGFLLLWYSLPRMCEAVYGPEQLGKPYRNQQGLVPCRHSSAVQL